jgi:hypothetical protein
MIDIYIGNTSRVSREFLNNGVATDLSALTVTCKLESTGAYLVTTAETTFNALNILANKSATGKYFTKITPDAAETTGVYLLYWTGTFGTGDSAESFTAGPDVIFIHSAADIPSLSDNYLSLDAVAKAYQDLFNLENPARILQVGWLASRDVDALLDENFNVPMKKNVSRVYDQPLIDAATALTIARILSGKGYREEAAEWQARGEGICDDINNGKRRLSDEVTKDEVGFGFPIWATSNTSANVDFQLYPDAVYTDVYQRKFIIKIDGAGAVGTATYKVSADAGNTWIESGMPTSELWKSPAGGYGLSFRFFRLNASANLAVDDYWTIDAYPENTEVATSKRGIRTEQIWL